jgi:SAM-dependent methyltransferase
LLGLEFEVSPQAFFQVNTNAAELLYSTIVDELKLHEHDAVVDVCCGTGTIALCCARAFPRVNVLGIELNPMAVRDATANAQRNDIKNVEFVCGRAEDELERILNVSYRIFRSEPASRPHTEMYRRCEDKYSCCSRPSAGWTAQELFEVSIERTARRASADGATDIMQGTSRMYGDQAAGVCSM